MRSHRFALLGFLLVLAPLRVLAQPLEVVATVPDLADLAETIGGDTVSVVSLAKGPQDVHFIEARPSFIQKLHDADLLLQVGMELESGWLPPLLQAARNPRVQPGAAGSLDASTAIAPLEVPQGRIDRSMGDVHPLGNPHYLSDPLNGLRVAAAIRDRLARLQPADAERFAAHYERFAERLVTQLVGADLAARHSAAEIVAAVENGTLASLRASSDAPLGGWLGRTGARGRRPAVEDHRAWAYFARRFDLDLVGALEPLPGIAPTTRHLAEIVARMRSRDVSLILATPYVSLRHAEFVAQQTGARIAELAHQVGSRAGTESYLAMIDYNVRQLDASR
ncbi:MAG: metal ABC transporter substrate-binding protein [Myxococcota bacterium]|nr:metal ABC transporter substrate-binding protein [Myxococcota bacterium]